MVTALCFLADLVTGSAAGLSAFGATLVCVLPSMYFAYISGKEVPSGSNGLGIALKGEAGRFLLSGVGFVLAFIFIKPLNVLVFFCVFGGLQVCNIVIPWREATKLRRKPGSTGH